MKNKKVFQTHMYQDFNWSTSLVDRADDKQHCALMISRPKKQKERYYYTQIFIVFWKKY